MIKEICEICIREDFGLCLERKEKRVTILDGNIEQCEYFRVDEQVIDNKFRLIIIDK